MKEEEEEAARYFIHDKTVIKWWLEHSDKPLIDYIPSLREPNRLKSFSINFKTVMETEFWRRISMTKKIKREEDKILAIARGIAIGDGVAAILELEERVKADG